MYTTSSTSTSGSVRLERLDGRRDAVSRRLHRHALAAGATALLAVVGAACGDDTAVGPIDSASSTATATATESATDTAPTGMSTSPTTDVPTTTNPDSSEDTAAPTTTAQPATPAAEVSVTFSEYSIAMPETVPAGLVHISATNTGAVDHHLMLLRLHDGLGYDEVLGAYATDPAVGATMVDMAGGPNGVAPGATQSAELWLEPGHYFAFCVIPTPEGTPHAAMGMIAQVEVVADDTTGDPIDWSAEPVDGTLRLSEYGFELSPGFDGTGRVLVANDGAQAHEVAIVRIGDGGSYDEFMSTLMADATTLDPTVAARYTSAGGVTPIGPGQRAIIDLDLPPGDYAFVCFVNDLGDGLPHFLHDMVRKVTIPTS